MSHASILILSETAEAEHLAAALERTRDGERLLILPPHLQEFAGSEPALNLQKTSPALHQQLIDNAITALRPKTLIADLPSVEKISPTLDRHPQLKDLVLISTGSEKKKHLKAQTAFFKTSKVVGKK